MILIQVLKIMTWTKVLFGAPRAYYRVGPCIDFRPTSGVLRLGRRGPYDEAELNARPAFLTT
jgi:hypothetical protein